MSVEIVITDGDVTFKYVRREDDPYLWDIFMQHDGKWSASPLKVENDGRDVLWQVAALCRPAEHTA